MPDVFFYCKVRVFKESNAFYLLLSESKTLVEGERFSLRLMQALVSLLILHIAGSNSSDVKANAGFTPRLIPTWLS